MKTCASLALILTLALLAGGCGGDDDSGDAGAAAGGSATSADGSGGDSSSDGSVASGGAGDSASPEKAEFVEQANQICVQNKEDQFAAFSAYPEEHPEESQKEIAISIVDAVIVPSMESLSGELSDLEVPPGDEEQVEEVTVAIDEVAKAADASDGDLTTKAFGEKIQRARTLAREYGLEQCDLR
jgi:hypothetical protein